MNLLAPLATGASLIAPLAQQGLRAVGHLADEFRVMLTGESETLDPTSVSKSETANQALSDFHRQLLAGLAETGVDVSQPIEVTQSPFGSLVVVSAHPQILDIERVMEQDASLSQLYDQIAGGYSSPDESAQVDIVWQLAGATARVR